MLKIMLGCLGAALVGGVGSAMAADLPATQPTMQSVAGRWMPDSAQNCSKDGGMYFLSNGVVQTVIDGVTGTWRYDILPDGSVVVKDFVVAPQSKPPSAEELRRAEGAVITLHMVSPDMFEGAIAGPNVSESDKKGGTLVRCAAAGSPSGQSLAGRWTVGSGEDCTGGGSINFLPNGVLMWEDSHVQGIGRYDVGPDQVIVVKDLVAAPGVTAPLDKEAEGAIVTLRMVDANTLQGTAAGPNMKGEEQISLSRCPAPAN